MSFCILVDMKRMEVRRSAIDGKGVFATMPIEKGKHIAYVCGRYVQRKNTTVKEAQSIPLWYGITETIWIDPQQTIFRYVNHSCNPSAAIIGTKKMIARRDLQPGEEITIDYAMTDADILWEMPCSCGERNCRKMVYSIQRTPCHTVRAHMPLIPRYFQTKFSRANPRCTLHK